MAMPGLDLAQQLPPQAVRGEAARPACRRPGRIAVAAALTGMLAALPALAQADPALTNGAVNMRAGPDPEFPLVRWLPEGTPVDVQGCLADYRWCDVIAQGDRGWVHGRYLSYPYQNHYAPILTYGAMIGLPIIGFTIGPYWHDHYVHRPWYGDRDRWERRYIPPPPPPRPMRPPPRPEYRPPMFHPPAPMPPAPRPPGMVRPPEMRPPATYPPPAMRPPQTRPPEFRPPAPMPQSHPIAPPRFDGSDRRGPSMRPPTAAPQPAPRPPQAAPGGQQRPPQPAAHPGGSSDRPPGVLR